jgi:hypothetical protein
MHYQKKDQEYSGETHYELFAYGRSKEFRPFHNCIAIMFALRRFKNLRRGPT